MFQRGMLLLGGTWKHTQTHTQTQTQKVHKTSNVPNAYAIIRRDLETNADAYAYADPDAASALN